jgi:hypothetical protein
MILLRAVLEWRGSKEERLLARYIDHCRADNETREIN